MSTVETAFLRCYMAERDLDAKHLAMLLTVSKPQAINILAGRRGIKRGALVSLLNCLAPHPSPTSATGGAGVTAYVGNDGIIMKAKLCQHPVSLSTSPFFAKLAPGSRIRSGAANHSAFLITHLTTSAESPDHTYSLQRAPIDYLPMRKKDLKYLHNFHVFNPTKGRMLLAMLSFGLGYSRCAAHNGRRLDRDTYGNCDACLARRLDDDWKCRLGITGAACAYGLTRPLAAALLGGAEPGSVRVVQSDNYVDLVGLRLDECVIFQKRVKGYRPLKYRRDQTKRSVYLGSRRSSHMAFYDKIGQMKELRENGRFSHCPRHAVGVSDCVRAEGRWKVAVPEHCLADSARWRPFWNLVSVASINHASSAMAHQMLIWAQRYGYTPALPNRRRLKAVRARLKERGIAAPFRLKDLNHFLLVSLCRKLKDDEQVLAWAVELHTYVTRELEHCERLLAPSVREGILQAASAAQSHAQGLVANLLCCIPGKPAQEARFLKTEDATARPKSA